MPKEKGLAPKSIGSRKARVKGASRRRTLLLSAVLDAFDATGVGDKATGQMSELAAMLAQHA